MPLLLILFIGTPIAEIALFIQAGELIGLWPTLGCVVLTALVGTALVRQQGLGVWKRTRVALNENRIALEEIFNGICLLLAGALLLTPGFLTDAIGFSLVIPPLRTLIGTAIIQLLKKRGNIHFHPHRNSTDRPKDKNTTDDIIDGEFDIIHPAEQKDGNKTVKIINYKDLPK